MARPAVWSLALAALVVLGCTSSSAIPAQPPTPVDTPSPTIIIKRGDPVIIGVSAALSGDQAGLGADLADAAALAVSDRGSALRGHPLQIERRDDHCSDPEKAVEVARAFRRQGGIVGVVGPMCTTGAQAGDSVYEAAQIVHILPTSTRSDLSQQDERFFFRTAWQDAAQASVQATYVFGDLDAASAVLIDDGTAYGKVLSDAFAAAYEAAGGRIISRERVERGGTDFSPAARQVTSADPASVVFEGLNPEGRLTLRALREAGYRGAFVAPDGVLNARDFLVAGDNTSDGAIVTGGRVPDADFVTRFRDGFKRDPSTSFVLQAHDAVTALLAAVDAAATEGGDGALLINRLEVAEKLRTQRVEGLTGPIQFDEYGDRRGESAAELGLAIYRAASGRFEVVK